MAEKNELKKVDALAIEDDLGERIQYIVVKVGSENYGINIKFVDNIVRMQKITRVPKAQEYFRGVINLRGEVVPVMSLRRRMSLEDDEFTKDSRIIILKVEENGLLGVVVDSVREVVTLAEKEIDDIGSEQKSDMNYFINGIGKNGEELISLLDLDKVIGEHESA